MFRRKFLDLGLMGSVAGFAGLHGPALKGNPWSPTKASGLIDWILRNNQGEWSDALYKKQLGFANEFKEGDQILGVAADTDAARASARQILSQTTIRDIDDHAPGQDQLYRYISDAIDDEVRNRIASMTLGELKTFLLQKSEQEIHALRSGLSSDVIACVVRLMTNDELIVVASKVFNPLPGTKLGAKGYLGARIQPNSPTDNVDDIRWQVFDAFSYAVGDVLIGTNPVSSDPDSVIAIERTLQDILVTFGIDHLMPHCVLAHIDVQAEAESKSPGSTALWFQSIAGNDGANNTFDINVEKMDRLARSRKGRYALYFETGQGADFTNGQGNGMDMVLLESRKYGFARALSKAASQKSNAQSAEPAWVHVNDVAGFIGPEVFRSRDQLVRCCLEDIVMGKLHGLMIGLDICSTLHMDVSLDDLGWCIDRIMPANPGYLMALPTRIDPMLGYLTTGYHDHVHIRKKFGYRVEDRMWRFFQELGVIDADGTPTMHFGSPKWVYLQYCRRKKDQREDREILEEGAKQLAEVRSRGVFVAEGSGVDATRLPEALDKDIHQIYESSKKSIWAELPKEFVQGIGGGIAIQTQSMDRSDYILHPTSGEQLSDASIQILGELKKSHQDRYDVQIIVSDGLNALAVTNDGQLKRLVDSIKSELKKVGYSIAPEILVVRSGRVRAGYRIGELLYANRTGPCAIAHIIGERPGSGHNTLSIYWTKENASKWSTPNQVDHNVTKVVSGIATTSLQPEQAALDLAKIAR